MLEVKLRLNFEASIKVVRYKQKEEKKGKNFTERLLF